MDVGFAGGTMDKVDLKQSDLAKPEKMWRLPGIGNRKELLTVLAIQISMALFLIILGLFCKLRVNEGLETAVDTDDSEDQEAQKNIKEFSMNGFFLTDGKFYFSIWQMTHLLAYFILAALFPDSWFLIWSLGLVWEVLEHCANWSNPSDVAVNAAGVALGVGFRKLLIDRFALPRNNKELRDTMAEDVVGEKWAIPMGVTVAVTSVASLFMNDTEGEVRRNRIFKYCMKNAGT